MRKQPASSIILRIKNELENLSLAELLWKYGTTDLSICAIMAYLDKGDEK